METNLNTLGIYELREYARKVGVKSPTTKVRAELEREILLATSGKNLNINEQNLRGRPPKRVMLNLDKNGFLKAPPLFKLEYYSSFVIDKDVQDLINFEIEEFSKRISAILEKSILKLEDIKNKE